MLGWITKKKEDNRDDYGVTLQKNRGIDGKYDYYLRLKRENEETILELSFTYRLGDWLNIRGTSRRDNTDTTHGVEVNTAIDFSNPKKLYYSEYSGDSSIRGTAFLDVNGNGIMDPGEEGISQIQVRNAAGYGITDENGRYYIPLLSSRVTHTLRVENKNEDYLLNYEIPENYKARTLPGGVLNLNIPVRQMKTIVGTFEFDRDFYLEEVEEILKNSQLRVTDSNTHKVSTIKIADEYLIAELPQGDYLFELVYKGNQNLSILNRRYAINMKDSVESEEYLDFRISKVFDNIYDIKLTYNGSNLYSLEEVKDADKTALKISKGGD